MKRCLLIVLSSLLGHMVFAQSLAGITGIRDTSYNIANEFAKHSKNYPNLQIVTEFNYPYIRSEKNIPYSVTKERTLKLDVFYPEFKPQQKRKAIIFVHGGGWRSGNKEMHTPLLQQLAALGYVCIAPEYRLSTEALYPAAVYDLKTAVRWVRKNADRYHIETSGIIIAGHSSGGELAAFMGATNYLPAFEGNGEYKKISSRVDAVIDLDGTLAFIHPESGEGDDRNKTSAATYWFGYSKTENPDLWKQAAPLTYAEHLRVPIQFINSGVARMHAGRNDLIAILKKNNRYYQVDSFANAPHTFLLFNHWFDSTVVYMDKFIKWTFDLSAKSNILMITVAQDGSSTYHSVQQAINSIPDNRPTRIYIKKGVYKEKISIDSLHPYITLIGEDKLNTIISYDDHTGKLSPAGDTINTRTSWTIKVNADHFTAQDISFRNDAGFSAGQAVAMESDGDHARFINCRFIGNQDVLFTNNEKSRQYYEHCYIEGTTDFIFGSSTVWFERCQIYCKKNSHVTAASTPKENEFGYIFNWCELTGDTSLHSVSLGRPWRPYAQVTYMNCYIGQHIKAEGWSNWNNTDNYNTTRFAEYKNYGPSSDPLKRVSWSRQLTDEEASKLTIEKVLSGWKPDK